MTSQDSCREHARRYHRRTNNKAAVINWYSHQANFVDQSSLRKFATPVASWIAYGPPGRIPTVKEFQLLRRFMDKMDGGFLPSRLSEVLCEMKRRLQSLPRPADDIWEKAQKQLRKSYRELLRRCNATVADAAAVAADVDVVDADDQEEALQVREAEDAGSPCTAQSDQHLVLFRKMNEWGFLDSEQKLEHLQQAEEVSRRSRRSLSQEELADILNMAAACLADPRRHARLQDADATDIGEVRTAPESHDVAADLQKRIRSLLLQALHVWQMNQFDCQAIEHVLDFVQQKIIKFETKAGEIRGAAAGKAWLKIKQMIDELLLQIQPQSSSRVHSAEAQTQAAHPIKRGRVERQSGIQHITWRDGTNGGGWTCRFYTGRKKAARSFPISKFLEEGLGEEAAVQAALQDAKAYREELVCQGKLKPSKPKPPRSMVMGVSFDSSIQKWRVRPYDAVEKKTLSFGTYDTKEEAEVKDSYMANKISLTADMMDSADKACLPRALSLQLPQRILGTILELAALGQTGISTVVKAIVWSVVHVQRLRASIVHAISLLFLSMRVESLDSWLKSEHASGSHILLHANTKKNYVVQHADQLQDFAQQLREVEALESYVNTPSLRELPGHGGRLRRAEATSAVAVGSAMQLYDQVSKLAEEYHHTMTQLNEQMLSWDKMLSDKLAANGTPAAA
ncbi:nek3 [Symbiodinium sp. CCMP2456]|nr:nek3 [Symbiodinium sp. CCMP2456]